MARSFDQVYAELGSAFDPSAQLVQQQIESIPGSTDALIQQADAKKDLAFTQITDGARRRGMGFSGIPLAEQATYASTEYAPAIANVKSQAEGRKVSLLESLNSLGRDRRTQAQGIYDNEVARDFQERQFQEQIRQYNETLAEQRRQAAAAARAAASGGGNAGAYLGGGGGGGGEGGTQPTGPSAADRAIFSRAKSLESIYKSGDKALFNRTVNSMRNGDASAKAAIVSAYKLIGMPNAKALKTWGLI